MADANNNPDNEQDYNELEAKIDEMMNPEPPKPHHAPLPATDSFNRPSSGKPEPIAVTKASKKASAAKPSQPAPDFTEPSSAPELPADLAKQLPKEDASLPSAAEAKSETIALPSDPLSDPITDSAVKEIATDDSNVVLAAEDAVRAARSPKDKPGFKERLRTLIKKWWFWLLVILVIVLVVLAVPFTRYKALSLFLKQTLQISVVDDKTNAPVSGAGVSAAGQKAETDTKGVAELKVPVGPERVSITKQYYAAKTEAATVKVIGNTKVPTVHLHATGRQVPVTVVNRITGKPVANAEVRVLDTKATTNAQGKASVVLPTKDATQSVTVQADGFNDLQGKIQVTDKVVAANTFAVVPSGKIVFLSNLSGKVDVVKSDLDGGERQTVLAGTGNEDKRNTVLLASRDWQYVALLSTRDGGTEPKLYLINTASGKVTTIDKTAGTFSLIGWYGHKFNYYLTRDAANNWDDAKGSLISYDADAGQPSTLDNTSAEGDANNWDGQVFSNFYIVNNAIVYNVTWGSSDYSQRLKQLAGKNDSIRAVQPDGKNKKDYQTFDATAVNFIDAKLYEPQGIYFAVYQSSAAAYYEFEDNAVKTVTDINDQTFQQAYPTFLLSPSGKQTFWTELRDGKNTLFVGDDNAKNQKQIASVSDYSPYGWFSDNYVLVSKNSSELYIMPASGLGAGQQPLKISDYYKPDVSFAGYGYGYGGL